MEPILSKSIAVADDRGVFSATSIEDKRWIQTNVSYNRVKNVFRGMHLQKGKFAQDKLVKVVNGSIVDMIVDLRKGDNYLRLYTYNMEIGDELLVPKGFAHGFLTLEEHTVVQYLVDAPYTPSADVSLNWKSFEGIKEMYEGQDFLMSPKDANAPDFGTVEI
jgi:dTDP-4-dehydrorhamnose 3,5-epimerase